MTLEEEIEYHENLAQHHFDQYSYHENKLTELKSKQEETINDN